MSCLDVGVTPHSATKDVIQSMFVPLLELRVYRRLDHDQGMPCPSMRTRHSYLPAVPHPPNSRAVSLLSEGVRQAAVPGHAMPERGHPAPAQPAACCPASVSCVC